MKHPQLLPLLLLLALWGGAPFGARAQRVQLARATPVDSATARAALATSARLFPKFYHALQEVQQQDTLLKRFVLVRNPQNNGPASAGPDGTVRLDIRYLEQQLPGFDDNRLVVVLYHEIGHLHYYRTVPPGSRTPAASERAAFDYSLLQTRRLADAGDCAPLQTGLKFMLRRSQSNDLADPHVRALQALVTEPTYADYRHYATQHCPAGQ